MKMVPGREETGYCQMCVCVGEATGYHEVCPSPDASEVGGFCDEATSSGQNSTLLSSPNEPLLTSRPLSRIRSSTVTSRSPKILRWSLMT